MIMLQTVDHVGPWRHIHILGGGRVTSDFYLPALRRMGLLKSATVVDPGSAQCADISAGFADVSVRPMAHDVYLEALEPPRGTGRADWTLAEGALVLAWGGMVHVVTGGAR